MKKFLLMFMLLTGIGLFGQNQNSDDVQVTMSMEPIIEYLRMPNYVQVVNTTPAAISFCDRLVYIRPGVHRIKTEIINSECNIYVFEKGEAGEIDYVSVRIVEGGIDEFSWTMDGIIPIGKSDYIEYMLRDFYLFSY